MVAKKVKNQNQKKKLFTTYILRILSFFYLIFWFFGFFLIPNIIALNIFFFFFILERISINGNYNYFHSGIYFQYCFRDTSLNFYHCVWKNETPKPLFQNSYLNHCGHHHGIVNSNRFINLCSL